MGRVKVFDTVHGHKLEKFLALRPESQRALDHARHVLFRTMQAKFALHDQTGGSFLVKEDGAVDKHVTLDDTKGDWAAAAIWAKVFGFGADGRKTDGKVFAELARRGRNYTWGVDNAPSKGEWRNGVRRFDG